MDVLFVHTPIKEMINIVFKKTRSHTNDKNFSF